MSIANTRMTLGSILGAITTTADTLGNTLGTINDAVGMANKVVADAAQRQRIDSKLDMSNYQELAIQQKSRDLAESLVKAEEWMAQSPAHKQHYAASYEKLSALFTEQK